MPTIAPFKVAACHVSPIYFELDATVDKTCSLIAEAAANGARLVAFPEAHLCAFPVWSGVRAPVENHDFFLRMMQSAPTLHHPAIGRIRRAARDHGIIVSIGINEASTASVGCLWDTNLLIGSDGALLNRHRKLVPTYWEKLTWANGDGSGLRVVDTPIGRIGIPSLFEETLKCRCEVLTPLSCSSCVRQLIARSMRSLELMSLKRTSASWKRQKLPRQSIRQPR